MTTDQEAENVAASVLHLLTQRGIDARNWQAQAEQHEQTLQALRREVEEAREILSALENETLVHATEDIVREEQTSNEAYQIIHTRYWKEAVPTIATLQAELEALTTERAGACAALQAARIYVDRMTIQVGLVVHDGIAPAKRVLQLIDAALGMAESPTPPRVSLGTCPRCGRELDNLSPGISVVAGGGKVCTTWLNPGGTEIARAKGLSSWPRAGGV